MSDNRARLPAMDGHPAGNPCASVEGGHPEYLPPAGTFLCTGCLHAHLVVDELLALSGVCIGCAIADERGCRLADLSIGDRAE
jgi:hypothetical protein